jgi:isocitrate dehydrogenase (NAD+)
MAKHTIVLIPGDGIGPEVTGATRRVLEAAGLDVQWIELPAGATAIDHGYDDVLPAETLAAIRAHRSHSRDPSRRPSGKGSGA